ncbi:MAG: hypothetical protein LC779_04375 [Actinobacteria bacterium]|nr:hypothetical protein [Actinomycetota bacterium]
MRDVAAWILVGHAVREPGEGQRCRDAGADERDDDPGGVRPEADAAPAEDRRGCDRAEQDQPQQQRREEPVVAHVRQDQAGPREQRDDEHSAACEQVGAREHRADVDALVIRDPGRRRDGQRRGHGLRVPAARAAPGVRLTSA